MYFTSVSYCPSCALEVKNWKHICTEQIEFIKCTGCNTLFDVGDVVFEVYGSEPRQN